MPSLLFDFVVLPVATFLVTAAYYIARNTFQYARFWIEKKPPTPNSERKTENE